MSNTCPVSLRPASAKATSILWTCLMEDTGWANALACLALSVRLHRVCLLPPPRGPLNLSLTRMMALYYVTWNLSWYLPWSLLPAEGAVLIKRYGFMLAFSHADPLLRVTCHPNSACLCSWGREHPAFLSCCHGISRCKNC